MCPLIVEAKTGAAPTPPTKSIGLGKVAAQKKQESSSEDSSSDSEDEQPPKVKGQIQAAFSSPMGNSNRYCRGQMNKVVPIGSSQSRAWKASSCC